MRIMAILLGIAAFVYLVTGQTGKFTTMKRLYIALGAFVLAYLVTIILVLIGETS